MTFHIFLIKFECKSISITSLCTQSTGAHSLRTWKSNLMGRNKNNENTKEPMRPYLFKSRIIRLWKSDDMRRLKDGREKSRSFGRSGWWFVGMWSCGFLRATLMSFSSRGRGPSLRIASCSEETFSKSKTSKAHTPFISDYQSLLHQGPFINKVVAVQATGWRVQPKKRWNWLPHALMTYFISSSLFFCSGLDRKT